MTARAAGGTSQRAVVPMHADADAAGHLVVQRGHVGDEGVELDLDAAGPATTASPSSVRLPVARSTRVAPSSRSRRATWVETLDWTVCRARAAAEKLPVSATASEGVELAEIHRWR